MNDKQQILAVLQKAFNRWQQLLASLSAEQISAPQLDSNWSVKDVVVHLWAWQQISVARAEAALHNREPEFPKWWETFDPDHEDDVDKPNAWFYETYRDKPWPSVYADWKAQFQRYLDVSQEIPDKDVLDPGRYAWMGGYALSDSLQGSLEHHDEHLDKLLVWLGQNGPA